MLNENQRGSFKQLSPALVAYDDGLRIGSYLDRCAICGVGHSRQAMSRRRKFINILVIAICAAICGADDWDSVQLIERAEGKWWRTFLELPNGISSHDNSSTTGKVALQQGFHQGFSFDQVRRIKAFGEPAIDCSQQGMGFRTFALRLP